MTRECMMCGLVQADIFSAYCCMISFSLLFLYCIISRWVLFSFMLVRIWFELDFLRLGSARKPGFLFIRSENHSNLLSILPRRHSCKKISVQEEWTFLEVKHSTIPQLVILILLECITGVNCMYTHITYIQAKSRNTANYTKNFLVSCVDQAYTKYVFIRICL